MQANHVVLGIRCAPREVIGPAQGMGALIVAIDGGSSAAKAGLRVGDVILEIDNQAVNGPEHAVRIGQALKKNTVLLRAWTEGRSRYFFFECS